MIYNFLCGFTYLLDADTYLIERICMISNKIQITRFRLFIIGAYYMYMRRVTRLIKADFHSVQFSERAEFCDRFLLKCVL